MKLLVLLLFIFSSCCVLWAEYQSVYSYYGSDYETITKRKRSVNKFVKINCKVVKAELAELVNLNHNACIHYQKGQSIDKVKFEKINSYLSVSCCNTFTMYYYNKLQ